MGSGPARHCSALSRIQASERTAKGFRGSRLVLNPQELGERQRQHRRPVWTPGLLGGQREGRLLSGVALPRRPLRALVPAAAHVSPRAGQRKGLLALHARLQPADQVSALWEALASEPRPACLESGGLKLNPSHPGLPPSHPSTWSRPLEPKNHEGRDVTEDSRLP